jgi:hypothetical protein
MLHVQWQASVALPARLEALRSIPWKDAISDGPE